MRILLLLCCLLLVGCDGGGLDGLKVMDGNGNVYTLRHASLNRYWVTLEQDEPKTRIESVNEKLLEKAKK